jgi:hypothetical protein
MIDARESDTQSIEFDDTIRENAKRIAINTAIILYNSTIAEITPIDHNGKLKIPGIPIVDTMYKKLYYTYFANETKPLFTEENHYIPLYTNENLYQFNCRFFCC